MNGSFLIFLFIVLFIICICIVEWVWNTTLVKAVTWARAINHWDAFKIMLLAAILVGGARITFNR